MTQPRLDEIQGNILTAYAGGHCARVAFFHFADPARGRAWLTELNRRVTYANEGDAGAQASTGNVAVNVAFTFAGLAALGVAGSSLADLDQVSPAFREGMARRAERLGDPLPKHRAAPGWWKREGATLDDTPVHAVVLVYAAPNGDVLADLKRLGSVVREYASASAALPSSPDTPGPVASAARLLDEAFAVAVPPVVPGDGVLALGFEDTVQPLSDEQQALELFGFRDGVSQPVALVGTEATPAFDQFILGGPRSLTTDGSFLVMRQLDQDLTGFWAAMRTQGAGSKVTPQRMAELAFGRQMDGKPLGGTGDPEDPTAAFDRVRDAKGGVCPFMSHVRRANPRIDVQAGANPRIMRRSLSYVNGRARGQMFMAYNADIVEQFEFIQSRWIQGGNSVGGRSADRDVIAGQDAVPAAATGPTSTVFLAGPTGEVQGRFTSYVRFAWGDYFFAPSRTALAQIASGTTGRDQVADDLVVDGSPSQLAAREALIRTWLDAPDQALRFWMHVKASGGLRIERAADKADTRPWIFVADAALTDAILRDDGSTFSVEGYAERMRQSTGRFFLGMDPCTGVYQREFLSSAIVPGWYPPGWTPKAGEHDALVLGMGVHDVRNIAFFAATQYLTLNQEQAALAPEPDPGAPFNLDFLLAVAFDAVCGAIFGVPGASAGSLVGWAADVTMYYFRVASDAIDQGRARQSGKDYVAHVAQLVDHALAPLPDDKPAALSHEDWTARVRLHGILGILREVLGPSATQEDLTRNLVGVMTGSLTATISLFTGALMVNAEANAGALRFDPAAAAGGRGEFPLYDAFVEAPLLAKRRGGPDHLYRIYKGTAPWPGSPIVPGDIVVVWVGGAAHDLGRGSFLFGGDRHHCPGERMGKALIDGVVGALATQKNLAFDPLTLTLRT